jgi:hypothetical protein
MDTSIAAALIAGLAALLGWLGGIQTERNSKSHLKLRASAFASDYFRDLRAWASEAIDVLSEAAYCAPGRNDKQPIDPVICVRCRHRLSALIDRGRFFIPNYSADEVGVEKPPAFRGLRHPALDLLVAAEQLLAGTDRQLLKRFPSLRGALVQIKREFVSRIQELLDPKAQNAEVAALIRSTRGDPKDKRTALERLAQGEHPDLSGE